jgi:hypothetical protein
MITKFNISSNKKARKNKFPKLESSKKKMNNKMSNKKHIKIK